MAPHCKSALIEAMKSRSYSLAVDGSNDSGIEKINPITARVYEPGVGEIVTRFLDMSTTTGKRTIV